MTLSDPLSSIRYLLDTDTVTYHQLNRPSVVKRLQQVEPDTIATTVITMYEQLRGRLAVVNRKQDEESLQLALRRLQITHRYFCQVQVVPFSEIASEQYRQLVKQKTRIGTQDLRIAALALAHNAILVTSNRRHFDRVPGLVIEDWAKY